MGSELNFIQDLDIYETVWYQIVGFSKSTCMLYKSNNKQGCQFLPHGNKDTHKLHMSIRQAESNVQSLIDLSTDMMPLQMKGIRKGRQDVQHFLPKTWKSLQECNNQVNYMEQPTFLVPIW
jgi:hypothetical protein